MVERERFWNVPYVHAGRPPRQLSGDGFAIGRRLVDRRPMLLSRSHRVPDGDVHAFFDAWLPPVARYC